MEKDKITK